MNGGVGEDTDCGEILEQSFLFVFLKKNYISSTYLFILGIISSMRRDKTRFNSFHV